MSCNCMRSGKRVKCCGSCGSTNLKWIYRWREYECEECGSCLVSTKVVCPSCGSDNCTPDWLLGDVVCDDCGTEYNNCEC